MSIFRDRQIKNFSLFIIIYVVLFLGVAAWFSQTSLLFSIPISFFVHDVWRMYWLNRSSLFWDFFLLADEEKIIPAGRKNHRQLY